MNTFHLILHRTLVLLFSISLAFALVYVPQPPKVAHALFPVNDPGGAKLFAQLPQTVLQAATRVSSSISAQANKIAAFINQNQWLKDSKLDGIAWALAKSMLSKMTSGVVKWVNSGFKGSPLFITDFRQFLLEATDEAFDFYLKDIDGRLSFLCQPFKLDVRISLELYFNTTIRERESPSCTFSGAATNLKNFLDDSRGFLDSGGWQTWMKITTNPSANTPIGAGFEAEASLLRAVNEKRERETKALGGSTMRSVKECKTITLDNGRTREDCTVTTPGAIIEEQTKKALDNPRDSLIQADEINEILLAAFGQLTLKLTQGTAGLLGLSRPQAGGGGSFYQQLNNAGTAGTETVEAQLLEALNNEERYLRAMETYLPRLRTFASNPENELEVRQQAERAITDIVNAQSLVLTNVTTLQILRNDFETKVKTPGINSEGAGQAASDIMNRLNSMNDLHRSFLIDSKITEWEGIINFRVR